MVSIIRHEQQSFLSYCHYEENMCLENEKRCAEHLRIFSFCIAVPRGQSVHIKSRITDAEMRAAVPMRHKAIYCRMLCGKGADSNFMLFLILMINFYAHTLIGISQKTYTVSAANIYYACHRFDSDRKKFRSSVEEQSKSTVSVYVACFPKNNTHRYKTKNNLSIRYVQHKKWLYAGSNPAGSFRKTVSRNIGSDSRSPSGLKSTY